MSFISTHHVLMWRCTWLCLAFVARAPPVLNVCTAGKGVSSSAAVEVAVMRALLGALGTSSSLDGRQLALLCQRVENLVVGAPCGIMDQVHANTTYTSYTLLITAVQGGWSFGPT